MNGRGWWKKERVRETFGSPRATANARVAAAASLASSKESWLRACHILLHLRHMPALVYTRTHTHSHKQFLCLLLSAPFFLVVCYSPSPSFFPSSASPACEVFPFVPPSGRSRSGSKKTSHQEEKDEEEPAERRGEEKIEATLPRGYPSRSFAYARNALNAKLRALFLILGPRVLVSRHSRVYVLLYFVSEL